MSTYDRPSPQVWTFFRLNFSHATHAELEQTVPRIRAVSAEIGRTVALLQDIQGPRLRTSLVEDPDGVRLTPGETVRVLCDDVPTTQGSVAIPYPRLASDVSVGDRILIADGNLVLRLTEVKSGDMRASVISGGVLTSHKGVNLPDSRVYGGPADREGPEGPGLRRVHRRGLRRDEFRPQRRRRALLPGAAAEDALGVAHHLEDRAPDGDRAPR